jgi:DNA polymerase-3 subunit epsilon
MTAPQKFISWIDTETTGLEAGRHEIIDIAIIRTTLSLKEVWRWSTKVTPERIQDASPKALEVNGYTPEAWADAKPQRWMAETITRALDGTMPGGHNVSFDLDFIHALWASFGIKAPWIDHRKLDTVGMAAPLLFTGQVPDLKLTTLTASLGIEHGNAHSAMSDAEASLNVARHMMRLAKKEDA